jgi:hemolysin III
VGTRPQSLGEEIANSLIHGVALIALAIAVPVLIVTAARHGGPVNVASASVFATTMILVYLTSTVYHALPASRAKRLLLRLDHGTIYLFIAGSYTPFALGVLGGPWGWTLFGLEWGLAAVGVALRAFTRFEHPTLSTGLYLVMGWLVLIAVVPLVERIPVPGVALLVAGGLAYTAGVVFFVLDSRLRYAHAIWHLFVIAGTGFHFFAVLGYAA